MAYFNPDAPQEQIKTTDPAEESGLGSIVGNGDQQMNAVDRLRAKYGITDSWRSVTPGAYVAEIQAVYPDHSNQRIYFAHDIAEGEHAGAYSAPDTPEWAHRALFTLKDSWAFEQLIKGLTAISASNPDFDAAQAFFDEDWDAFVGKHVGVVLQEHEYVNKHNDLATALNTMRFVPVDEVPNTPAPPIRHLRKEVG